MTAQIDAKYLLNVRQKPKVLGHVMRAFQGGARISFKGNLKRCRFGPELLPSSLETAALKRATEEPELDFLVLPLEKATVEPILKQVLQAGFRDIVHIQIERDGKLQFGAYDNFRSFFTSADG
jgi:hypothetical protein